MGIATKQEVLVLELVSVCPTAFTFAERQILKSREVESIERLMERKIAWLRFSTIAQLVAATFLIACVIYLAVEQRRLDPLIHVGIWCVLLYGVGVRTIRTTSQVKEISRSLVDHLHAERAAA